MSPVIPLRDLNFEVGEAFLVLSDSLPAASLGEISTLHKLTVKNTDSS